MPEAGAEAQELQLASQPPHDIEVRKTERHSLFVVVVDVDVDIDVVVGVVVLVIVIVVVCVFLVVVAVDFVFVVVVNVEIRCFSWLRLSTRDESGRGVVAKGAFRPLGAQNAQIERKTKHTHTQPRELL